MEKSKNIAGFEENDWQGYSCGKDALLTAKSPSSIL